MARSTLADHAKAMRRQPTEPEKRLWRHLSNSQLDGFKFRRQAVVEPFIVDFLCPAKALIVELDGETHADSARDARRDADLVRRGYRVVRFTNGEVMGNMGGVLTILLATLNDTPDRWPRPHPNPSPEGEGLRPAAKECASPSTEGFGVGTTGTGEA